MPKISALPAMVAGDLTTADLLCVVDSTGPTTRKSTVDIFRVDFMAGVGMTATPLNGVTSITTTLGVGVGAATSTSKGLNVSGTTALTAGTSQYGAFIDLTFSSASTTAGYGIYVKPTTAAAAFTQVNTYGIYVDTATIGAGSAITNQYGIYINTPSGAGTINRALYIAGGGALIAAGGLQITNGNIGLGTAAAASVGIYMLNAILTASGNTSTGILITPTMDSTTTTAGRVMYSQLVTATAAFTMVSGYGLYVDTPSKGAGSAITTAYGIMVKAQSQGTTNNYGIWVESPSGGATNNEAVHIVPGKYGVRVTGTSISTATAKYGYLSDITHDANVTAGYGFYAADAVGATATTLGGIYVGQTTTAAAFTLTNRYGVYIDNIAKGAGSTITNDYGLYIVGPTQGGTTNIGAFIGAGGVQVFGGNLIVSNAAGPQTNMGIAVGGTQLVGTSQYAFQANPTFSSASTTAGYGLYLGATTAAAGFTHTNHYGVYIDAVAKGAGSTITNRYGLYIVNPTDGGTLNRAIFISGAAAIVDNQGKYTALSGTAVPATAGAVAAGAPFTGNSNGMTIEWTTDAPTHTRPKGSLCLNLGGSSTSTRAYINTDGAGTWTAITTAA